MTLSRTVRRLLGVLAVSVVIVPQFLTAADPAGIGTLTESQKASITVALAESTSLAEIIRRSVAAGMDLGHVTLFLCSGNPSRAYDIVYAAVTVGGDAAKAVAGALQAGMRFEAVVRAAKSAGARRATVAAAALSNGFTATQFSNAWTGGSPGIPGGGAGGGPPGGGYTGGGGFVIGGGYIGGGAGGNASPSKP